MFLPAAVTDNNAVSMLAEQPTSSTSDDGLQDISILTTTAPYLKEPLNMFDAKHGSKNLA